MIPARAQAFWPQIQVIFRQCPKGLAERNNKVGEFYSHPQVALLAFDTIEQSLYATDHCIYTFIFLPEWLC